MCYTWDRWLKHFPCVTRGNFAILSMTQHGQEWDAPGPQGYCMQRDKENSLLHIGRQSTNNYIFLPVLMLLVPLFLPWSYLMDTSIQSGVRGSSWWNVRQRMDRPRLFNWMMQLFVKHIPPTRPVMLFVGGHSLHYGPETIQAAAEAEIMIFLSSLNSCGLARVANSIAVCTCLCKIVNGLRNHKKLAKSWLYIYSGLELKKGGGELPHSAHKTLPFCFSPISIMSCLHRKDTRLSLWYIFTFRRSLGMRLCHSGSSYVVQAANLGWGPGCGSPRLCSLLSVSCG